jgi:putative phage-type endonuclease
MNGPQLLPKLDSYQETHASGFGASEAAAVVGQDPYCTPWELYHRKTRDIPDKADSESIHLRRGVHLEPFIVAEYQRANPGQPIEYPMGTYRHPVHEFVLASPDAGLSETAGLECKSIGWRVADMIGEPGTNQLPPHWICQGQQQMAVMGWETIVFAVLVEVETLKVYHVERHDGIIEALVAAERELWERIQNREPPEPECWAGHLDAVKRVFRTIEPGKVVHLTDAAKADWTRKREIDAQVKALEDERDTLKAHVYASLGDAQLELIDETHCIRRQMVKASTYTVERRERVDFREVKIPKGIDLKVLEVADG